LIFLIQNGNIKANLIPLGSDTIDGHVDHWYKIEDQEAWVFGAYLSEKLP